MEERISEAILEGGETGIAEGGKAVEDGLEDALAEVELDGEGEEEEDAAEALRDQGEEDDETNGGRDLREVFLGDHFSEYHAIMERHATEQDGGEVVGEGHDAQTADLNEAEDKDLACGREELSGIFDGESGHTNGAGAGEERVEPGEGSTVDNGAW